MIYDDANLTVTTQQDRASTGDAALVANTHGGPSQMGDTGKYESPFQSEYVVSIPVLVSVDF